MNETILYNVWHENAFGILICMYFFLGGMGAGSFLVSAFSKIWGGEKYKDITNIGAVAAFIMINLGGLCLFLDLGRHLRVFYLFRYFSVTSPVSWGSLIIALFALTTVIYMYFLFIAKDDDMARLVAKIGIIIAVALASYTGLLISLGKGRPMWHSAVMPPLFLVSSCISGIAIVTLTANLLGKYSPKDDVIQRMSKILVGLILVDIFLLNDMYVLYIGIAEAKEVAMLILVGKYAFLFWGIELLLGSVLPVVLLWNKSLSATRGGQIIAGVCSLIGVFTMRYIIIIVGQYFPLS
jgi:formate-dependent nitrite reductase membrane component NrfD